MASFPVFYPGVCTVSYDSTVYTAQKVNEVVTAQDAGMRCVWS